MAHIGETTARKHVEGYDDVEHVKNFRKKVCQGGDVRELQKLIDCHQGIGKSAGGGGGISLIPKPSHTTSADIQVHRLRVCQALLMQGMSFEFLRDPTNDLRLLLEGGNGNLPLNAVAACIPMLREAEIKRILEELEDAEEFSFTFDGKFHIAELMDCAVRFVIRGVIQHRVAALKMLLKSMDGREEAAWLNDVLQLNRWRALKKKITIRFCCRDGAAVNGAALEHLSFLLQPHGTFDVICQSHSANVAGLLLSEATPLASKATDAWSALVTNSGECRRVFQTLSGEAGKTKNSVRWYEWFEVASQIRKFPKIIRQMADRVDFGCDGTRAKLARAMDAPELNFELALIEDAGKPIVCFCYAMEGDGFLAPICYDLIMSVVEHGKLVTGRFNQLAPVLPVSRLLQIEILKSLPLPTDQAAREMKLREVVLKSHPMFDKVNEDTRVGGRLFSQLQLMRAARLFNFPYVARHGLAALIYEINAAIPYLDRTREDLCQELINHLDSYHTAACGAVAALDVDAAGAHTPQTPEHLWAFWNRHEIQLPVWYKAAKSVAIIFTSSGCAERVFALYTSIFTSSQESSLEDRVESSVMFKFNTKERAKLLA